MQPKEIDFYKDICKKDFGILKKWTNQKAMSAEESYENLITLLTQYIYDLLTNDYNRLLDLLYRTDISEKKVREVFAENETDRQIARCIAILYLERLSQKWKTRQEYSNLDNSSDEWLDV